MYTSFWFDTKLVPEKAKEPAGYELAIRTVFKLFYRAFLKKSFACFQVFQKTFLLDSGFNFAFDLAFSHITFFSSILLFAVRKCFLDI